MCFGICMGDFGTLSLRGPSDEPEEGPHVLVSGVNAQTLTDYDQCSQNLLNTDITPLQAYIVYLRCIGDVFRGREATLATSSPTDPVSDTTIAPVVLTTPAPAVRITPSGGDIFLWLEWPGAAQGASYYDKVISFVNSNTANYRVTKIIARVNDPNYEPNLWQVSTSSTFYVNFLSRLPRSVEIRVYPYLFDSATGNSWMSSMNAPSPLEAVYKYASAWNSLLGQTVGYTGPRITGVVADKEEQQGFGSEMSSIPSYQSKYSTPGFPPIKFGSTAGYDSAGSVPFLPGYIDEVYLEMYDFYINGVHPAVVIESSGPGIVDNPSNYLAILDNQVWGSMIPNFSSSTKINFMWSLQHKGASCLYPMGAYGCGAHDDLGNWSPSAAADFLRMVANKYSVFGNQPKGFFQFSFLPSDWM